MYGYTVNSTCFREGEGVEERICVVCSGVWCSGVKGLGVGVGESEGVEMCSIGFWIRGF